MRPFLRTTWAVLWKDLAIERRAKEGANALGFFAILLLFLFYFALGPDFWRLGADAQHAQRGHLRERRKGRRAEYADVDRERRHSLGLDSGLEPGELDALGVERAENGDDLAGHRRPPGVRGVAGGFVCGIIPFSSPGWA